MYCTVVTSKGSTGVVCCHVVLFRRGGGFLSLASDFYHISWFKSNVQLQLSPCTRGWTLEAVWSLGDENNLSASLLPFRHQHQLWGGFLASPDKNTDRLRQPLISPSSTCCHSVTCWYCQNYYVCMYLFGCYLLYSSRISHRSAVDIEVPEQTGHGGDLCHRHVDSKAVKN
jgi:hypothetical protein